MAGMQRRQPATVERRRVSVSSTMAVAAVTPFPSSRNVRRIVIDVQHADAHEQLRQ